MSVHPPNIDRMSPRDEFGGVHERARDVHLALDRSAADLLMPMHLVVSSDGRIRCAGPTMLKLRPQSELIGCPIFDVFVLRRPAGLTDISQIPERDGGRVSLSFLDGTQGTFKGVAVRLPANGDILINLSFGFSVIDAVEAYDLSSGDFAATDLAVEMLYLVEAKSAAMQESKKLNLRLQGAKVAAEEQAFTDTLTGLKNRRAVDHVLARILSKKECFGLMQVDLDYFKQVNDTFGHAAGDEVLQSVARSLVAETRQSDTVARIGGDEFILVFDGLTDTDQLELIAWRIIARLEEPIPHNDVFCRISGSIGVTTSEIRPSADVEQLLADADRALYASKNDGRGRCTLFDLTMSRNQVRRSSGQIVSDGPTI
ncbi:GGDEF domain-containing protein [Tropicimonas marinistellae]|uniref:GGDEF domain-containing protein n=1 Tax=Tropicimonas marinistellae TaxID=1739787 RepID=UPI000AA9B1C0|nr:GGDEF domain-containing protein [Tropicimonas marinistellae]